MALANTGQIALSEIRDELGQTGSQTISLTDASDGDVATINQVNIAANRPDGAAPHAMTEFYSYDHDENEYGLLYDDFYTTGTNTAVDSRLTYVNAGIQGDDFDDSTASDHGEGFMGDSDDNQPVDGTTNNSRPQWTFRETSGNATSHEGNAKIRMGNTNSSNHAQWRHDGNGQAWMNSVLYDGNELHFILQYKFTMSTNNNKDLVCFIETADSQGDGWGVSGGLDDGWHIQLMDDTKAVRLRKRTAYNTITTIATSTANAFTKGTASILTFEWNKNNTTRTGSQLINIDGTDYITATETSFTRIYGLRFMSSKAMTTGQYNDVEWLRMWREESE